MTDHAIALSALLVSLCGVVTTAIGAAWAMVRHCRRDDFERGQDRARLDRLERVER